MKTGSWIVATGLGVLALQALVTGTVPDVLRPDLMLVFTLGLGLHTGGSFGLVLAFLCGFAVDALSGAPLGLFALLRGTACATTRALDGALYLRAGGPWAVFVIGYTLADLALMGLLLRWLAPEAALAWGDLALRAPGTALATGLVAAPLLALLRRIDVDSARDSWGLMSPGPRP